MEAAGALSAADLATLAKSWITPELAQAAGLYRVESAGGRQLVGRNGSTDCAGIVFPNFAPGTRTVREVRLRLDHPEYEVKADGTTKEKQKYLAPPGRPNFFYFAPDITPAMLEDAALPVVVTEGEKKTLSLQRLSRHEMEACRFVPVGLTGVWNWRGTVTKEPGPDGKLRPKKGPIRDFDLVTWQDRRVYLLFDSNVRDNVSVRSARRDLAAELTRRGAKVHYIDLPADDGINGIDDYLYLQGPDAALKLFATATEYVPLSDLPAINATDQRLERVTDRAWNALVLANTTPFMFRRAGEVVRIEADEDGAPIIREINEDHMRHILARVAFFYYPAKGDDEKAKPALPPIPVVKDVLVTPFKPLPALTRIVEAPIFSADGTLQTQPGYCPSSRTYYAPADGFTVPPVSPRPTDADMAEALRLIDIELLGQFPFTGEPEKAHAVALLLLPFVREFIHGPTPLHLFEKPCPGTGASLLVDVLTYPATGNNIPTMTEGRDEDEWRKRITSKLVSGTQFILIDNLRRRLDSAAVSAAITAGTWEDRRIGHTQILRVPVRCAWCATGNNVALSAEITRRTVRVRLDARIDRPWLREGFRHPDLREWARSNRAQLVWAALSIIRRWISEGRPKAPKAPKLGMFENWSEVMAGILHSACIPGFLSNLDSFYDDADAESEAWRAFVSAWWGRYQGTEVDVSDLFGLAGDLELGDGNERSQKTKLGKLLGSARDRTIGKHRILKCGVTSGRRKWQLVEVS